MKIKQYATIVAVLGVTAGSHFISGCSQVAEVARKVTYPADFKYVSKNELRETMGALLEQVQRLKNAVLEQQEGDTSDPTGYQAEVVQALADIERIAGQIDASQLSSNHPFLVDQMGEYRSRVSAARIAATHSPPRFYLVEGVIEGCARCHTINRR